MAPKLSEDQLEACELRDAVIEFAEENGWSVELKGCNKAFAFVKLVWGDEAAGDEVERFQAFYAVDESRDDKFMHTLTDEDGPQTRSVALDDVKGLLESDDADEPPLYHPEAHVEDATVEEVQREAEENNMRAELETLPGGVPPTDAAHTVPPIVIGDDAAHTEALADMVKNSQRAAHSAAHTETIDVPVEDVPPTELKQKTFSELDAAQRKEIVQKAKKHHDSAAHVEGSPGQNVASQMDTYEATKDIELTQPKRSSFSSFRSDELIKMASGKTLSFFNGWSGKTQTVDVTPANETARFPVSITPSDMEEAPAGDDPRMLHFIEHHGGFRSVAVARLTAIR